MDEQTGVNMLFSKSHADYFNDCGPFWKPRGGYRTPQMQQEPSSWLKPVLGDPFIHGQMRKLTADIPSSLPPSQVVTTRTRGKPLQYSAVIPSQGELSRLNWECSWSSIWNSTWK